MKPIEADKLLLDNVLGLSCIENYTLYILHNHGCDYRFLYAKSFVQIFDIAKALCDENIPYAYFNKIPRLQDMSHKAGLIQLSTYFDFEEAVARHEYCCIKVTPSYVRGRYSRELWRDDHFILLCNRNGDSWTCLNDNPRDVMDISTKELRSAYAGQAICICLMKKTFEACQKEDFLKEFQDSVHEAHKSYDFSLISVETARDILGVIRVLRKRMWEYCSLYFDASFMRDYLMKLDKTYAMTEYMRLRNRPDLDKINRLLEELQMEDLKTIEMVNQQMELVK